MDEFLALFTDPYSNTSEDLDLPGVSSLSSCLYCPICSSLLAVTSYLLCCVLCMHSCSAVYSVCIAALLCTLYT